MAIMILVIWTSENGQYYQKNSALINIVDKNINRYKKVSSNKNRQNF